MGKKVTEIKWQNLQNTKSKRLLKIRKDIEIKFDEIKTTVRDLMIKKQFSFERLMQSGRRQRQETLQKPYTG